MIMINLILIMLSVILSMAFFTLLERKMMAYSQIRKGPNKVSIAGLFQPFADAIKLLMKEWVKPMRINRLPFMLAPIMMLMLSLIMWMFMPPINQQMYSKFTLILFLMFMSLNVYPSLISGWMSNSKYASIGSLRAIAQTISYEITMAIIMISTLTVCLSFNSDKIMEMQKNLWVLMLMPMLTIMWLLTIMAETNRTPFDLVEGESELVSGFNVEYSSSGFTLIFIAEYVSILLMSMTTMIILMNTLLNQVMMPLMMMKTLIISTILIMSRITIPRLRYDSLMELTWMTLLPMSLIILLYSLSTAM